MKLKNITKTYYKLIELELLKTKKISKEIKINLYNFIGFTKESLIIIFKYHSFNKKIFFFGIPKNLYIKHKKMLTNSRHLFFPEFYEEKGLFTNKINIFKYLKKKIEANSGKYKKLNTKLASYFSIKSRPDLIVILSQNKENNSLIVEAKKLKIPVITLEKNYLYFTLIYSIIKKKNFNVKKKTI